ncbi:MAG: hypothetical protein RLZZ343_496, partial [Actinomycetota bacterium]
MFLRSTPTNTAKVHLVAEVAYSVEANAPKGFYSGVAHMTFADDERIFIAPREVNPQICFLPCVICLND